MPSDRLDGISPSAMRALFEVANKMRAEGKKVIDFGLGDINIPLPEPVLTGIKSAVDEGKTKYGPNQGELPLREKIAELNNRDHNLDLTLNNILISCGSLESLYNIAMAYVNPGDEVLIAEPEFAYFGWQVMLAGGKPVPIGTSMDNEFMLSVEQLQNAITPKTKALLINYPNNPTAAVLTASQFKAIVEVCEDNNILLISDEAYEKITFDGFKHKSALDFDYKNTLVVNSASKALCMTGLRVGYAISTNYDLLKPVIQVHQYNTAHAAVNNQYGVLAGMNHFDAIISNSIEVLQTRRDAITKYWSEIPGLKFNQPKATFYFYPDVTGTGMTGEEFAKFALDLGVVVVPGNTFCFDKSNPGGANHIRASYGITSPEEIKDAAKILIDGLNER